MDHLEAIPTSSRLCQRGLRKLRRAVEDSQHSSRGSKGLLDEDDLKDVCDRFDGWADNLGAFKPSTKQSSLENRLRENTLVRSAVLRLLADLASSIDSATLIAKGERENRTSLGFEFSIDELDSDLDSDWGLDETDLPTGVSEIEEIFSAIQDRLGSLFRAAAFIRTPDPESRRQKASKAPAFDSSADKLYVLDRFPKLRQPHATPSSQTQHSPVEVSGGIHGTASTEGLSEASARALAAQLGEANARRRQYFQYCKDHQNRLSSLAHEKDRSPKEGVLSEDGLLAEDSNSSKPADQSPDPSKPALTVFTRPSIRTATETTRLSPNAVLTSGPSRPNQESAQSVVSFATSVRRTVEGDLPFPALPDRNLGFICPYCHLPVDLKPGSDEFKQSQWRKHVLKDLEPYVCTFPGCGVETYASESAWFTHELSTHRLNWACPECDRICETSSGLKNHIQEIHLDKVSESQLPAVIRRAQQPQESINPADCPFCDDNWATIDPTVTPSAGQLVVDIKQFREHVGQHLVDVALFAIPRLSPDLDETVGNSDIFGPPSSRGSFSDSASSYGSPTPSLRGVSAPNNSNRRQPIMPHRAVGEFTGLLQLRSSSKLILDDPKRVQKVFDRGEAFRLKREGKRQTTFLADKPNTEMTGDSNDRNKIDQLAFQLDSARVSNALEPEKRFIPQPQFARILTFELVSRIVSTLRCLRNEPNKEDFAKQVYYGSPDGSNGPAIKLLAVLIGIDKAEDFAKHLEDGIRDTCLPLMPTGATRDQFLKCRTHGMHGTINSYLRPQIRESFSQWSHALNAPFIKWEPSLHSHYVLETGDVIPVEIIDKVTQDDTSDTTQKDAPSGGGNTYGGFSEVYKVKIHDGHWDFGDHGIRHPQEFFALKKLTSHNRNSFDLELSSLLFTGQNYKKKHLIQLLATFEVVNPAAGGLSTYYLLFDWAEGDLSKFWQNNESLVGDKSHCLWMAEQFHEICEALQCVHNDRAPTMRYLEDRDSNEDLYGRHGDIKPGNFLWFHSKTFPGLLVLSDFGLGRLHTQVSRSKQDPRNLERSASYRCPEFDLPFGQVSPRSDIFSLGCVFLEYVTWFFLGFDAVENVFPGKRLENDIYGFESDIFFSVKDKRAHIKPSVLAWIQKLQNRPDCSWYLWDLLEVIQKGMLEPNSDTRIRANQLTKRMHDLLKACKADEEYYLGTRRALK